MKRNLLTIEFSNRAESDVTSNRDNGIATSWTDLAKDDNNEGLSSTSFIAVKSMLILLLLGIFTSLLLTWCIRRPSWNKSKSDLVVWMKRGGVVASGTEKEAAKVGWNVDDFECWTSSLVSSCGDETEHERLLLAVTPHHLK